MDSPVVPARNPLALCRPLGLVQPQREFVTAQVAGGGLDGDLERGRRRPRRVG